MKAEDLLALLTKEDIVKICEELGSNYHKEGKDSNVIIFDSFCHGSDSLKLWYYHSSHSFMCYSCCGAMNLWQLVALMKGYDLPDDFYKVMKFVADIKGVSLHTKVSRVRRTSDRGNEDMEFLRRHLRKRSTDRFALKYYDDSILQCFEEAYPLCWLQEGIEPDIAEVFDIRYYENTNQAIIPHRALDGQLIGVRCRCFNEEDVEAGRKYIPLKWNGEWLRYPTGSALYGLYENQHNIRRMKRARLFEAEKSVHKYGSYYGQENNIALALCGTNFTPAQRDMLLSLGVKDVDILLDREYCEAWFSEEYKNTKEQRQMIMYFKKLQKMVKLMVNYFNVNVVLDYDEILDLKDSPIDKGRAVLEQLLQDSWTVADVEELDELINIGDENK